MGLENVSGPNDHGQARVLLAEAWRALHGRSPSVNELNAAQTIAHFETVYGRAGQFAEWARQGKFNWGALQRVRNPDGSCPAGMQPGQDAANLRCFFVYPSDYEAAKAFLRVLTVNFPVRAAATLRAMATGDLIQVAQAMRNSDPAHAFFELDANEYGRRLVTRAKMIFGPAFQPSGDAGTAVGGARIAIGLLALGTGIWYYLTRFPPRAGRR